MPNADNMKLRISLCLMIDRKHREKLFVSSLGYLFSQIAAEQQIKRLTAISYTQNELVLFLKGLTNAYKGFKPL
jgi:hypothetical protein